MSKNRKKAEQIALSMIEQLAPGSQNTKIYQDFFNSLSDEEFDKFVRDVKSGEKYFVIQEPNLSKKSITIENNLELAEKWGHRFFERVWMDAKNGAPSYLSNESYLIVKLPLRRVAQILIDKISIPEDNRSVDLLTGQPTGTSKGSKISYPELQALQARNLPDTIIELIKYRGGDMTGFNAMNDQIARTGGASINALSKLGTETKSTVVLSTYLTSMHLSNTL